MFVDLPIYDCVNSLIGPSGLLSVVSHLLCSLNFLIIINHEAKIVANLNTSQSIYWRRVLRSTPQVKSSDGVLCFLYLL